MCMYVCNILQGLHITIDVDLQTRTAFVHAEPIICIQIKRHTRPGSLPVTNYIYKEMQMFKTRPQYVYCPFRGRNESLCVNTF